MSTARRAPRIPGGAAARRPPAGPQPGPALGHPSVRRVGDGPQRAEAAAERWRGLDRCPVGRPQAEDAARADRGGRCRAHGESPWGGRVR